MTRTSTPVKLVYVQIEQAGQEGVAISDHRSDAQQDDVLPRAEAPLRAALDDLHRASGKPATRTIGQAIGVSHSSVADALRGKRVPSWPMLEKIVNHLGGDIQRFRALWADAASPPSANVQESYIDEFLDQYRDSVKMLHGYIRPAVLERSLQAPVDDVYISPTLQSEDGGELQVIDILSDERQFLILGDPGAGKSSLCQFLAYRAAINPADKVPFLIRVRDFARGALPTRSVVDYIEYECNALYQTPPPDGVIRHLLDSGRAIVLLDGLDELLQQSQRTDIANIIELFAKKFSHSKVVVTSRRVGYAQAPLDSSMFTTLNLTGFDDSQVSRYATNWFSADESHPSSEREQLAHMFLLESDSFPDLRKSPLLLSLMCTSYRNTGLIPRNRTTVIEQCAELLFNRWDQARGIAAAFHNGRAIKPALGHLAHYILKNTDDHILTRRQVIRELTLYFEQRYGDYDEAEVMAREFIDFCAGRAWVFSDVGSNEYDALYSFTHRTFLEYFAAIHLVRTSETPATLAEVLASRVADNEWVTVSQFAAGYIDQVRQFGSEELLVSMAAISKTQTVEKRRNVVTFITNSLDAVELSTKVRRELKELTTDVK